MNLSAATSATDSAAAAWAPDSWRGKPALQLPVYPDENALQAAMHELGRLPPLVTSWEIFALKRQLAEAQEGKRFLLQGGDCAENFSDCESGTISNRLKVLLQMSLVLVHGLHLPVVRVGRFAGQYAKPRSADTETRDGVTLPSYRGDVINAPAFTEAARVPDPRRMITAHSRSAMTMNFVRALIDGGFADLHHPEYWNLDWVGYSPLAADYQKMVASIGDAVRFMETLSGAEVYNLNRIDFYTSHEALLLPYEEGLTRQVPRQWGWFNLSTHYPWIGMRTAALDGAHVEYLRGVRNPIAIKVGPSVQPDQLLRLIDVLNPEDEPGRLSFIHRMGAAQIADKLPPLLDAVKRDGRRVLWVCDAMHGNTESTGNGYKTRRFDNIRNEVETSFDLHAAAGTRLGGVHLELTGEDVTECTGGARELTERDLERAYRSSVDPRLNYEQSLEIAMAIVRKQQQVASPPLGA
ncbi:class II 3-deoxy-7-phosphoheptulonate synthase [Xanthomonas euvesicatoria]|uniref:Phospho-2-dehydro-3-deoxyheptonate aldolase n=2 Tax=Xanthomonas euvesicatoria TaxID=456327 RepID=A0AAW3U124_XANEU|nr:3-deoxy-7-phosphoheptulonate synthase class II [Xanthomonas euvesicatoria]MBB4722781.1 3-deoxy-7-phosphoheptulonate synthase [Xanthomonas euvesicatoria]MBB4869374.1 3-deoxy-7-phosphoheptulonate synthase [Xanthomonas euvesicatoria]MBV6883639.1 3-deoxy-7-phosphoheptulonate synthase class II [Xanthomonas campestris pv. euphorbiae]